MDSFIDLKVFVLDRFSFFFSFFFQYLWLFLPLCTLIGQEKTSKCHQIALVY